MKFFIRSDSSKEIGSGHVMRCLTLADALRKENHEIEFICKELPGNSGEYIEKIRKFKVHLLPALYKNHDTHLDHSHWLDGGWEKDADQVSEILSQSSNRGKSDWLIVDHYGLDQAWEKRLRSSIENIFVIDDLADRKHDCDILLDQNFKKNWNCYDHLVPSHCLKLLGPNYALLRPQFRKTRQKMNPKEGEINRISIFYGGGDPSNETGKALETILDIKERDLTIDVVVGSSNPNFQEIEKLCQSYHWINFYSQVDNMARLLARGDLAFGAGGTTSWERCSLGLPTVITTIAKNQEEIAEMLALKGAAIYAGKKEEVTKESLGNCLRELLNNPRLLKSISMKAWKIVDARGSQRVVESIGIKKGQQL